ncbi:MAG: hypothetical protein Q7U56_08385, partial [Humidesulfovibrio sp.]|nr:hypothetical protein [Humidesulfovibrio sp.]
MARFIEEPELIAQMGAAGRRLAEEKYAADLVVRDMLVALGLSGMQAPAPDAAAETAAESEDDEAGEKQ